MISIMFIITGCSVLSNYILYSSPKKKGFFLVIPLVSVFMIIIGAYQYGKEEVINVFYERFVHIQQNQ